MKFFMAFFFLAAALSAVAQVRLTGNGITKVADYGDPSIPDFLPNGNVRVLATGGAVLTWKTTDDFFQGHSPRISMILAAHPDKTLLDENLGEDLWDPSFHTTDDGEEILIGSVMSPAPGQKNARWPEDCWSRRVFAFHQSGQTWIRARDPMIDDLPKKQTWINHGYGHEFLKDDRGDTFLFYEKVTEEKDGTPWKTEIFGRRFYNENKLGPEISILKIPSNPWAHAIRSFGGTLVEGPRPFKRDGMYFISFSAGDYNSDDYGLHIMRSTSITGPFRPYVENNDLKDFGAQIERISPMTWGAGRGSFFEFKSKWWVIFHGIPRFGTPENRDFFLGRVNFSGDAENTEIKITP